MKRIAAIVPWALIGLFAVLSLSIAFLPRETPLILGQVQVGRFTERQRSLVYVLETEKGASYELKVVDAFNNGADIQLRLRYPSKGVIFWITRPDGSIYPKETYLYPEKDLRSATIAGLTPPKKPDPVASFTAQDGEVKLRIEPYRQDPEYIGDFLILAVKRSPAPSSTP